MRILKTIYRKCKNTQLHKWSLCEAKHSNFKYLDFKKYVDPNVHVKMFNFAMKVNVETSKKYIINAFRYML
jgi:hypothetical protein